MKDSMPWFKHDAHARNDIKLVKIRQKFGLFGIGFYWCLVEALRESDNYEMSYDDAQALGESLCRNDDECKCIANALQMLCNVNACAMHGDMQKMICIPRLKKDMEAKDALSQTRQKAAQSRWVNPDANALQMQSKSNANRIEKNKNRKEEKRKEKNTPLTPQGELAMPPGLESVECQAAWNLWLEHKRSKGKSYKSVLSQNMQLKRLAPLGGMRFVRAVEYSIAQNYDGVYEEKTSNRKTSNLDANGYSESFNANMRELARLEKEEKEQNDRNRNS